MTKHYLLETLSYNSLNEVQKMFDEEIQQLRQAAEQENWDLFKRALQSVICHVKKSQRFGLLLPYIQIFMKDFQAIYPQYMLIIDDIMFDNAQTAIKQLIEITRILSLHKGEPGVNNFRKAISNFEVLYDDENCNDTFTDTFVNTIINLFIGVIDQDWGRAYPDLYIRWLHGTIGEDFHILKMRANSPEYKQRQKALFYQIAEDINKALQPH